MLCYAMLCYAMLCYAMLCWVVPCYAVLCYARDSLALSVAFGLFLYGRLERRSGEPLKSDEGH